MSWWRIGLVRRWWALTALAGIGLIVALGWGGASVEIPSSDGPRVVRQLVIALLPCLVSPVLVDQLPTVSATLVRDRRIALVERLASQLVGFGVAGLAWARLPEIFPGSVGYETAILALLLATAVLGTSRWGTSGVLATCVAAMVWLLAGDTLASLMGFETDPFPGLPLQTSAGSIISVAVSVLVLVVANVQGVTVKVQAPVGG